MFNYNNHEPRIMAAPGNDTMRKTQVIFVAADKSGSMGPHQEEVFSAIHNMLDTMVQENQTNVDVKYLVHLVTFNNAITECTGGHAMEPEDAAQMFQKDDYICDDRTGLAALYEYFDKNFTRSAGGLFCELRPGDPVPIVVIPTDMVETDTIETITAARDKLMSNRLFTGSKRIVIFIGDNESKRQAAANLAGGEENVICIDSNLKEYMSPVLCDAPLLRSDSTHISNINTTPKDTGLMITEKLESGKASQANFRDTQLEQELEDFLSGKNQMSDEELEQKMAEYLAS